jgi:precorrin-2/cobalt-factor-2 C20-methyltransferase
MAGDQAVSTLYGLGVGPGDPELITVKAWRIIGQVPVIAYPVANGTDSLARRIASPFIPEDVLELRLPIPMRTEREPAREAYEDAARLIAEQLDLGKDIAFLCEGDPFFYGSFMYVHERLQRAHTVMVVPGVTSLTACAAAIGRPLAARNELLKVIPAPLEETRLTEEIATAEAVAIIKVGKHFDKVRRVLRALDVADRAFIIERATREDERILALEDLPEGERPYFSTILVYRGGENW